MKEQSEEEKQKKEGEEEPSCPDTCSSQAHSCWIEKADKSGKVAGKCYVGTGRVSGNKTPMTQDQCEDHGGSWCKKQEEEEQKKGQEEKKNQTKTEKRKEKRKQKKEKGEE